MNKTYVLKDDGWVRIETGFFGDPSEWRTSFIPEEVSDCAARTGSRRIAWDGRNAIPLDGDHGRVRVIVEERRASPPVVIERRGSDAATVAGTILGAFLGGAIGHALSSDEEKPKKKTRRGGRGRR